jgi:hypothetical protein
MEIGHNSTLLMSSVIWRDRFWSLYLLGPVTGLLGLSFRVSEDNLFRPEGLRSQILTVPHEMLRPNGLRHQQPDLAAPGKGHGMHRR